MTSLDQFTSVFKSADKAIFSYQKMTFKRILVVTDLKSKNMPDFIQNVRDFLSVIDDGASQWDSVCGVDFNSVQHLLDIIQDKKPDLIVTYRHLHSKAWQWPYSLGEYLDIMSQATAVPVVVMPHPDAGNALPHSLQNTDRVMAMTDHLTGDNGLVNMALSMTSAGGQCWLVHVENKQILDRYMDVIGKIPSIETDQAHDTIAHQLLKEPKDFIDACRSVIENENSDVTIEAVVVMGRHISEYRELIQTKEIDMLVFNTKDDDQLAMHGAAYALAVELRTIPLMMV